MGLIQPGHPNSPLVETSPIEDGGALVGVVYDEDVLGVSLVNAENLDFTQTAATETAEVVSIEVNQDVYALQKKKREQITRLSNEQLVDRLTDVVLTATGSGRLHTRQTRLGRTGVIPTNVIRPFVNRSLLWLLNDGVPKETGTTHYASNPTEEQAMDTAVVGEFSNRIVKKKVNKRG